MFVQEKIEHYYKLAFAYARRFRDVRFTGQVLFAVVVLLISWSGVKAIETNYQLQRQIAGLQQQTDIQKLKNINLKLQNEYYNSNQYLDLSARQNFGLAAPGEKVLIVPKTVALAHTIPLPARPAPEKTVVTKQSRFEQNYQDWTNFFLHRPPLH